MTGTASILLMSLMGAVLGFAAHRAGLCTVKAVAEVLTTGRAHLLVSFAKSAVWVMGLAALVTALSWEGGVRHWPVTLASLAGGLAFGMGAAMNGGCVFSTASRAMDGDLGLVMTILGWPIGILLVGARPVAPLGTGDLGLPEPLVLVLGLVLMVELGPIATRIARSGGLGRAVAAPVYTLSAAAAVIGIANAVILILAGPWSLTRTVLCFGAVCDGPGLALAISLAALLGMAASSLQRGSFRIRVPRSGAALRHGAAGVMMGIGMGMIPGGNDGLILYAIPSLSPHALPGYAAILAGILLTLAAMKALGLRIPPVICAGDICRNGPRRSPPRPRAGSAAMSGRVKAGCDTVLDRVGRWMARRLTTPVQDLPACAQPDLRTLQQTLRVGDVVLVEGREYISTAIKYLTQSTWSHAALFVGDLMPGEGDAERPSLVEVTLGEGCIAAPLSKYCLYNLRICRPHGMSLSERERVAHLMIDRIGTRYDHRNIVDLARYFFPTPPVPVRWRRRMLALGSGDPTRAICSSMIAEAFQSVRYPILPEIRAGKDDGGGEIYHIRHHSLFAPRDFDLSPYFEIVKPHLEAGFDHRALVWADTSRSLGA